MSAAKYGFVAKLGLFFGILSLNTACGSSPDSSVEEQAVDIEDAIARIDQALTQPSNDAESINPETSFARLYYKKPNGVLQRICGGAMQTNLLMVTARHCVKDLKDAAGNVLPDVTVNPANFFVLAGQSLSSVKYAVFHPNGAARDIAGLRLNHPLSLKTPNGWVTSGYIRPPIAQQPTTVLNNKIGVALAGYGSETPGALRITNVQNTFQRVVGENPDTVGVEGPSVPVPGDSGGPIFIPAVIMPQGSPMCTGGNCFAYVPVVGVIADGFPSATSMAPGIDIFLSWTIDHGF